MEVFVVVLLADLILGVVGGAVASAKGRSFFSWFLLGFLTQGFALFVLIFLSSTDARHAELVKSLNDIAASTGGVDLARWASLIELDPEVAAAAETVRRHGERYERMLAEKYLPLNDRAYLQAAVDKVIAIAERDRTIPHFPTPNMRNVAEASELNGFPLYRMKDGTFALGCRDGRIRMFANRQEAEDHQRAREEA
ncbi:MAG: hypothetical protein LWW93_07065 [Hyphomicrobiales bacterium]|nr:hypothetical protein [Hyphomicrobiales bacterium]